MKKWILLLLPALCLLLAVVVLLGRRSMRFEEITKDRVRLAVRVECRSDPSEAEDYSGYLTRRYRRFNGDEGNTAQTSWDFYDGEGRLLFTLTELGNRNLIRITMDGKYKCYHCVS